MLIQSGYIRVLNVHFKLSTKLTVTRHDSLPHHIHLVGITHTSPLASPLCLPHTVVDHRCLLAVDSRAARSLPREKKLTGQ